MGTKKIVAAAVLLLVAAGCADESVDTTTTPTSTTVPETTTTTRFQLVDGGLIEVDPTTLVPRVGAEPVLVADRFHGVTSANRRWTAIESVTGDSVVVSVVDLEVYEVVSSGSPVARAFGLTVANDGTAYWLEGTGTELIHLPPGADSALPAFRELPLDFAASGQLQIIRPGTIGLFGIRDDDFDNHGDPTLITVELDTGTLTEFPLPGLGPMTIETTRPAVVWDVANDRVLIVEAIQDVITEVALGTGDTTEHPYQPPTAQGLEDGADRDAALSPDGLSLYVATRIGEAGDGQRTAEPQDLLVFDTGDWSVTAIDANVDHLYPSPDGSLLLANGVSVTSAGDLRPSPVYVIDMAAATVQIAFQTTDESATEVSYSRDGTLAYLTTWPESGMKIDVLDLELMQLTGAVAFPRFSFLGEAGLLAFHLD